MKAYIDFDIVAYRCAASCEPTKQKDFREPLDLAILRTDELLNRILVETEADEYVGWISGSENFRKLLYPLYKANRDSIRRPEYLQTVREFVVNEWGAKVTTGYEADDAIGIAYDGRGVICSIDKDFKQIPGRHYNFVTFQWDEVSDLQADRNFWSSLLIGDRSDNVPGIPGIGKAKAPVFLDRYDRGDWRSAVKELYEQYDMDFDLNYDLLHILRDDEEWFNIENKLSEKQRQILAEADGGSDQGSIPGTDRT